MLFIRSHKKSHNKCSVCNKVNFKEKSEIIRIETPAFTKVMTICAKCQKEKVSLYSEIDMEKFEEVKLT